MKAELVEKIIGQFPSLRHEKAVDWDVFTVDASRYTDLASFIKGESDLDFDHLSDLSAVDYVDYMEVVCHFYSYNHRHKLRLKTRLSPGSLELDSLTSLWATANWHEREAWDLYGVVFKGHPNLKRILSADDQEGHPFRKTVPLENDENWLLSDTRKSDDYGIPDKLER